MKIFLKNSKRISRNALAISYSKSIISNEFNSKPSLSNSSNVSSSDLSMQKEFSMQKVKRLYYDNTYLYEHQSVITEIGKDDKGLWVRLSETIFHPKGGGQKADQGLIAGKKVLDVIDLKESNEINHYLAEDAVKELKINQEVKLEVDKSLRLEYAVWHTAGHLFAHATEGLYPLKAVKGHQYTNEGYYEFTPKQILSEQESKSLADKDLMKKTIEHQTKTDIKSGLPVAIIYSSEGKRAIKIGKYESVGCGGTHLNNVNEIGDFSIKKISKEKDNIKISYSTKYKL